MVRLSASLWLLAAIAAAIPAGREPLSQQILQPSQQSTQKTERHRKLQGRILHITDLHPDPFYQIGTNPAGEHPCHTGKGHNVSGFYGAPATQCDAPFTLIEATFAWIKENIKDKIDFVIWTGDSARHDNDYDIPRSHKQILDLNRYAVEKFVETFGKIDNIGDEDPLNDYVVPIVPTYGNNDIMPHNIFTPGPNKWTRDYVDIWRSFIPQEQKHSFARGGWFWKEVIPDRLAVISLNTMYFFSSNAAVDGCALESEPGYEHMEWLRIQLQFMRERGLKTFIIGHVPPARTKSKESWDESCYQKYMLWLHQYRDVIVANIYGHMNVDHFMFHDIEESIYQFDPENVDAEHIDLGNFTRSSWPGDEFHTAGKSTYLGELRHNWSRLPKPPKGTHYNQNHALDAGSLSELYRRKRDDFFDTIGGFYGERFSMSIVSPSVVPNYFPTLRIIEYNITGLENDHPAIGDPQGHLATEGDLQHHTVHLKPNDEDEVDEEYVGVVDIEKKKRKKHRKHKHKKNRHGKVPKEKPDFPVPYPPSKTSLPGPAYSPQTFSLLAWTQLYANLTTINAQMTDGRKWKGKDSPFKFEVEYVTDLDPMYNMTDLTVRHWLDLAERMGRVKYHKRDVGSIVEHEDSAPEGTESRDEVDNQNDDISADKKKHRDNNPVGKLKDNELWHEFVRRAYVHSLPDSNLRDDFD